MGNPIPIQERSVDPYSSYDSNVVNKLTRMISDGNNVLLEPSPITVEKTSNTTITANPGKAIMDDVLIETQDLLINMADSDFYVNTTTGVWNENGYYYIVLCYQYAKTSPAPTASIKIIKPSQRASVYNPAIHLFLGCANVMANTIVYMYDFDPDNGNVKRSTVGGGSDGTTVGITEVASGPPYAMTNDDDTVMCDTSVGDVTITIPDIRYSNGRIIRIIKKSADSNVVHVNVSAYTIESLAAGAVMLNEQWESITLLPYVAGNVWIRV